MSSYKVSEPSTLKFLKANGAVVDENGNVISETSDYWKKAYDQAEPKPDKILHSDGTIKDSAGNLIQDTTEYNVQKYNQAEPIPAKYLHADGSISEDPAGNNKVYAWIDTQDNVAYFNFDKSPEDDVSFESSKLLSIDFDTKLNGISIIDASTIANYESYSKNSDTEFEIVVNGVTHTYTRDDTKDFELWKM